MENERVYQGLSRKELAFRANIAYQGIGLGLERDSMPGADTAIKVAKVLNVSVEYLLGSEALEIRDKKEFQDSKKDAALQSEANLYLKNKKTIDSLERLPVELKAPIEEMIVRISNNTEAPVEQPCC